MKKKRIKLCGWLLGALAALAVQEFSSARAAGLLIADGGLGGVLQVEALYTFPVPKGASVANFSMWINGKEMVGEVLEKKRAREIYQSYKQTRRDPGLLEQTDFKTFEMRVFPIAPSGDQKVQITYYQELDVDHDWATYIYPLATSTRKDLNSRATGKFAFSL